MGAFQPSNDESHDLGTTSARWQNVHADKIAISGVANDSSLLTSSIGGGGLEISKTTGVTGDEASNAPCFTSNTRSFQVQVTTDAAVDDNTHSVAFLVNNSLVSSSSVIIATVAAAVNSADANISSESGIQVYSHTITDSTSFKFTYVNRTGSTIATDSVLTINFVIL